MSENIFKYVVDENAVDERLDKYLYDNLFNEESLSEYQSLISRSVVKDRLVPLALLNQKTHKASRRLKLEDIVEISSKAVLEVLNSYSEELSKDTTIVSQLGNPEHLNIIEETDDYIVLNKSNGLVVHPGSGNTKDTLANYLRGYLEAKGQYDVAVERAGIVHRLDKPVSGLMVVAKNRKMQLLLKAQFEAHTVLKVYRASLSRPLSSADFVSFDDQFDIATFIESWKGGALNLSQWTKVEGYITRHPNNRIRMQFLKEISKDSSAKEAVSYIMPLSLAEVFVKIETGRMHQIRATLAYLGSPISGDTLYGKGRNLPESIALRSVVLGFKGLNGEDVVYSIV